MSNYPESNPTIFFFFPESFNDTMCFNISLRFLTSLKVELLSHTFWKLLQHPAQYRAPYKDLETTC